MSRPYQRCGMPELESLLLVGINKQQLEVLEDLREELTCRSTHRAAELLERVEKALAKLKPPRLTSLPRQPELELGPVPPQGEPEPPSPKPSAGGPAGFAPHPILPKEESVPEAVPALSAAEAAKILGVSSTSRWEEVEKARRALVRNAVSGTNVAAAAEQAARANRAYGSLAAQRRF